MWLSACLIRLYPRCEHARVGFDCVVNMHLLGFTACCFHSLSHYRDGYCTWFMIFAAWWLSALSADPVLSPHTLITLSALASFFVNACSTRQVTSREGAVF